MVKKPCHRLSCWQKHVRAVAQEYPHYTLGEISKAASETFKNRQPKRKRAKAKVVKGGCGKMRKRSRSRKH